MLQGDETPTPPAETPEPTEAPANTAPTMVPDEGAVMITPETTAGAPTIVPTVSSPGESFPNAVWTLPWPEDESIDFGGMVVDDDTVYRLLATPSFVGVQAVDGKTGTVEWQQAHRWAGHFFTIEDDVLYFDGGDNTLTAVDAKTGTELWRASVSGAPLAIEEDDQRIFVLLDTTLVSALDKKTGQELWVAQGSAPQNESGGSASDSSSQLIAVEENVVAVISTSGVLSGFDMATGEELWSHEGYEAATSSIETEDDRFIVIDAAGLWANGQEVTGVGLQSGTPVAGSSAAGGDCVAVFTGGGLDQTADPQPTPEGMPAADGIHVQAIVPATGQILWEQQAGPGVGVAWNQIPAGGAVSSLCAIEVESGNVISISVGDDQDDAVVIGSISSGTFYTGVYDDDMEVIGAVVTSSAQASGLDVSAAIAEDDAVYLHLVDGTLVKVHVGDFDDDDDHHEDRDDDSDDDRESDD
ncbi:MAG: PQQ-like beta-propeller repeat protein [Thermomicrobiales bacterium]|nr:PQQ-like beta-propeller repeat protein [Thermomicrobiales bacterium]